MDEEFRLREEATIRWFGWERFFRGFCYRGNALFLYNDFRRDMGASGVCNHISIHNTDSTRTAL